MMMVSTRSSRRCTCRPNEFNASRIRTVVIAAITTKMERVAAPGNVKLTKRDSRLPKESVVNVSQVLTIDRSLLTERVATLPERMMFEIDAGLRLVLAL